MPLPFNADSYAQPTHRMEPYADDTYNYYCSAMPDAELTDAAWKIVRVRIADSQITFPLGANGKGTDAPTFTATDLATVQGHFVAPE